jgi:uncharacterized membrane protein YagU involved in acid resistance
MSSSITIRNTVLGGAIAGVLAGIVMGIASMFVAAHNGQGMLSPLYMIGGLFWGVNALIGGHGVALVGLISHLVFSGVVGAIFALMTRGTESIGPAFVGGLAFGIMVWAVMTYLVQPWANPTMNDRVELTQGWWFIEHLVFGGMLFTTPIFCRAIQRGAEESHFGETLERRHAA